MTRTAATVQCPAQLDTVDVGQAEVDQREVGVRGVESRSAGAHTGRTAAGAHHAARELRTDRGVVLDDQHGATGEAGPGRVHGGHALTIGRSSGRCMRRERVLSTAIFTIETMTLPRAVTDRVGPTWAARLRRPGYLLLPLRAFLGITFCYAGLQKLANPAYLDRNSPTSVYAQMHALEHQSPIGPLVSLSTHAPTLGRAAHRAG